MVYIDEDALHEVPFQGISIQKSAYMTLNRFKNETDQNVFWESRHSLTRLENVKNS